MLERRIVVTEVAPGQRLRVKRNLKAASVDVPGANVRRQSLSDPHCCGTLQISSRLVEEPLLNAPPKGNDGSSTGKEISERNETSRTGLFVREPTKGSLAIAFVACWSAGFDT